jgi:flagellar biosynthetic protein FliP
VLRDLSGTSQLSPIPGIERDQRPDDSSSFTSLDGILAAAPEEWTSRSGLSAKLQILLMVSVLSLAPSILLMTTCYVRVMVVLGLLRQALGAGQLPPTQVLASISIFITVFVMTPVWSRVYVDAV